MGSRWYSRIESDTAIDQGRRASRALRLLAIGACLLLAALVLSAAASPPSQAADTGSITGTVTYAGGSGPPEGFNVTAYRSDDWIQVAYDRSDPITGDYDLDGLPTGDYRVYFRDDLGDYVPEYYDDQLTFAAGLDVHVNAPDVTSGIDAELALAGRITGRVTDADGVGLGDIFVEAVGTGDDWSSEGWPHAMTETDGTYDLGFAPAGDYHVSFYHQSHDYYRYVTKWFDNKSDFDSADAITVTAGQTTAGVDAELELVRAHHGDGHRSGRWRGAWQASESPPTAPTASGGWDYVNDTVDQRHHRRLRPRRPPPGRRRLPRRVQRRLRRLRHRVVRRQARFVLRRRCRGERRRDDLRHRRRARRQPATSPARSRGSDGGGALGGISVTAYRYDGSGGLGLRERHPTNATAAATTSAAWPPATTASSSTTTPAPTPASVIDDKPDPESADDVTVNAGATTSGIDAELALAGQITGTVTKADGGEALGSAVVAAYRADGSGGWDYVRDTTINATSGSYVIKALPTGDYRIGFRDDSGIYAPEFFDDELTIEAGEDVHVNAPDVTSGIDAALAMGGHISGTVTDESTVGLANMQVAVYESDYFHHMGWAARLGADRRGRQLRHRRPRRG